MPFELFPFGTAGAGLLAFGIAIFRITEEAGFLDRGISEDLVRTREQNSRMTKRFWEVFWSPRRKIDRLLFIGGIATIVLSFIVISITF